MLIYGKRLIKSTFLIDLGIMQMMDIKLRMAGSLTRRNITEEEVFIIIKRASVHRTTEENESQTRRNFATIITPYVLGQNFEKNKLKSELIIKFWEKSLGCDALRSHYHKREVIFFF